MYGFKIIINNDVISKWRIYAIQAVTHWFDLEPIRAALIFLSKLSLLLYINT